MSWVIVQPFSTGQHIPNKSNSLIMSYNNKNSFYKNAYILIMQIIKNILQSNTRSSRQIAWKHLLLQNKGEDGKIPSLIKTEQSNNPTGYSSGYKLDTYLPYWLAAWRRPVPGFGYGCLLGRRRCTEVQHWGWSGWATRQFHQRRPSENLLLWAAVFSLHGQSICHNSCKSNKTAHTLWYPLCSST